MTKHDVMLPTFRLDSPIFEADSYISYFSFCTCKAEYAPLVSSSNIHLFLYFIIAAQIRLVNNALTPAYKIVLVQGCT